MLFGNIIGQDLPARFYAYIYIYLLVRKEAALK
jgi:hypothetical protein